MSYEKPALRFRYKDGYTYPITSEGGGSKTASTKKTATSKSGSSTKPKTQTSTAASRKQLSDRANYIHKLYDEARKRMEARKVFGPIIVERPKTQAEKLSAAFGNMTEKNHPSVMQYFIPRDTNEAIDFLDAFYAGKLTGNKELQKIGVENAISLLVAEGVEYSESKGGRTQNGFAISTRDLIKRFEGKPFLIAEDRGNGIYTLGYGYDFTKESDPKRYNTYVVGKEKLSQKEADELVEIAGANKGVTEGLNAFIAGEGFGNTSKPLQLNQNQYDALYSYFYSNGPHVFEDSKYDEWSGYGGEYTVRAEARLQLRDYLINENGNYAAEEISKLFINSKGGSLRYDFYGRRKDEAEVFNAK